MKNKIIATLLATTIIMGTMPVQAIITDKTRKSITSLLNSRTVKLKDGTYTIPVSARKATDESQDSMANNNLTKTADVYVENGKIKIKLEFTDAKMIKNIGVKVNDVEPEDCKIENDNKGTIVLTFGIETFDDKIKLPMKINPTGLFSISADTIIKVDKTQLKDENGEIVDLDKLPSVPSQPDNGDGEGNPGNGETDNGGGSSESKPQPGTPEGEGNNGGSEDGDNNSGNGDGENNADGDNNNGNDSEGLKEGIIYTIKNQALAEGTSTPSAAAGFLNEKSELELKDGIYYLTLKFTSGSMMKNQKVFIDGTEVQYETLVNDEEGNFHIKFPIKSLNNKIKMSMFIIPVKNDVAFDLKLDTKNITDPDGNKVSIGSGSGTGDTGSGGTGNEVSFPNAPEVNLNEDKKFKAEAFVIGSDGNATPIIANYMEDKCIVQVEKKKLYAYFTFANPDIMSYRELSINGERKNFSSTVNSNGTFTVKVELNSINDTMEFTNLLTRSLNDGFIVRVNGNTLEEYTDNANNGNNNGNGGSNDDLEDGTYTIQNKVLKENSNSESVARDYLDNESLIEVKNDKIYVTLKFTKGSLMSDIGVKVNGKNVSKVDVVKNSGDKYHIKFKIGSLSDEILISSKIKIMGDMNVKFRVLLRSSTLEEDDDGNGDDEDGEGEGNGAGGNGETGEGNGNGEGNEGGNSQPEGGNDNLNNGGSNGSSPSQEESGLQSYTKTTYSIKNEIVCDSQIGYQAARDAIGQSSTLEVINDKTYLTLNLHNTDLMSRIKVLVSGNEVKYNTLNKNSANNTMSIKFEVPNDNPDITIKSYINMINREISFGVKLLQNTKTFVKTEEVNSKQLEEITGSSDGSDSSWTGSGSGDFSGGSSSLVGMDFGGSSDSGSAEQIMDQLSETAIEASEYFKRYTINNEIVSDSAMGRTMARKYLNETSILEEIDGQFYITVTFTGTSAMDNFRFTVNGAETKYEVVFEDEANGIKSFRFPINSVNDDIQSFIFIKPVKMNINFGIKLLEDTMVLVEEGTVGDDFESEDISVLDNLIDKTTRNSSTGEISPMKIAVSTSALTIIFNQLISLASSYFKRRRSYKLLNKITE